MIKTSAQDIVVLQYHKLVECSTIEQAAADDQVLLAQQIRQVRVSQLDKDKCSGYCYALQTNRGCCAVAGLWHHWVGNFDRVWGAWIYRAQAAFAASGPSLCSKCSSSDACCLYHGSPSYRD